MTSTENRGGSRRPRPLLMVPLRRCGSHALRLRLNFNREFYSPYPLHIIDFMPLVPMYGDLDDDRNYFQLVVDVVGLQAASMVKWPGVVFDPAEVFDAIQAQSRSVHRVVWELLLRAGEHHGAKIVMDKSLDSVHYATELMQIFPDMLFLNVVRDPRAQVASMNRAIIHDFDTTLNAKTWVEAHDAGRALAQRHPERVLTIRYEDFLSDQERTLRNVCVFMGIEFLPQMLDVADSQEAQQLSKMSDLWSSNCFAPIPANKDKFKSQLSGDEIETIETVAREHMLHYGYEFMTGAQSALPNESALASCQDRSARGRAQAWRQLAQNNYRDHALRRFRADYLARLRDGLQAHSNPT
ncbi:sulfotransferase family protein [Roseateles saccharophilus]|uniref:Sulfotransferase family protein n=1 Tax=Roseateles saccharophilus TaxID=304 RepID=A0A4R3UP90_ROSSA|nr:sulfotransferase [Roseateles saccharophilus]MDG0833492.1 sulfotransferase [Roseateles saccharophilus]TCU92517.1 sulfotransferase family protein [Roseateles saccharophilus]